MNKTKLCLGLGGFGMTAVEQIRYFKKLGFEGFFSGWSLGEDLGEYRKVADEEGMIYQSVHAPFMNAAKMWKSKEEAQEAIDELIACLKDTAKVNVPIMVCHPFIGFEDHDPTECGIENYREVVEVTKELGVKVAIENTEGQEYLEALMEAFKDEDMVGFCWDTGHEMCYNRSEDLLAKFGDKLICTHINDNLGIKDYDGEITWIDDLHLLPFDGIADWEDIVHRMNKCGYNDILTFELTTGSKPGRHENDKYAKMGTDEYLAEAYARACRVAVLKQRDAAK